MARELPHSVRIAGRRTSVRLDSEIWEALQAICEIRGISIHDLCTEVEGTRGGRSLVSALRVYAVLFFREMAKGNVEEA